MLSRASLALLLPLAWSLQARAQQSTPAVPVPAQTQQTPATPEAGPTKPEAVIAPVLAPIAPADERPLPDIPVLMHQVEVHQREAEALERNYIYRSESRLEELDGSGNQKKTVTNTYEDFWMDGVPVRRHLSENGKPLSPDAAKKENDRIDKEAARARARRDKADAEGKETDPAGHDEITVSRMLELGAFTNPRRILVAGRPTILIDYTGDPKARTNNAAEAAFKELTGSVSIDEQDRAVQHIEGRFFNNFKLGGGLLVNVSKDTQFELAFTRVNDEAWFLQRLDAHGHARYLLFFSLNGSLHVQTSDFRKFKATSTISPVATEVKPDSPTPPEAPRPTSSPKP